MLSTAGVLFWGRTLESQSFDLVLAFKLLLPENARKLLVLTNIDIQSLFSKICLLTLRFKVPFQKLPDVSKCFRKDKLCFDITGVLKNRYLNKVSVDNFFYLGKLERFSIKKCLFFFCQWTFARKNMPKDGAKLVSFFKVQACISDKKCAAMSQLQFFYSQHTFQVTNLCFIQAEMRVAA